MSTRLKPGKYPDTLRKARSLGMKEKFFQDFTLIEYYKHQKKNSIVSLIVGFQKKIEQVEPQKQRALCSIKKCGNHKRLRRCHICFELFCPKHLDMHFHFNDPIISTPDQ